MLQYSRFRRFVADFETTVFDGQAFTEVWASGCAELFSDEVLVFQSIEEQYEYFLSLDSDIIVYYHNLKFDGAFWLDYILRKLEYQQAYTEYDEGKIKWHDEKLMQNKSFKYCISDKGQWYTIIIKVNNHFIEFRDSYKLLPFKLKAIGKGFKTQHQKLEMEYKGYRYSGCDITDSEMEYIKNDIYVLKEAMEIMMKEGNNRLTIGSCCLSEYKNIIGRYDWKWMFPDLTKIEINSEKYGSKNVDEYIRKSYKGGWCYIVKGKELKVYNKGTTADVNSLYPSVMHSESKSKYPIGKPMFWNGNYIPEEALKENMYYFIRIRTRFKIKHKYLPCIQIKNNWLYNPREWLVSSDKWDAKRNRFSRYVKDKDTGETIDTYVTLTLTMTDYILIKEHYDLIDCEILDGCYFRAMIGLFDSYIDKYKEIKMNSKGAQRTLAKLFLNNLYGKLASSDDSTFKVAYLKNGQIKFKTIEAHEKDTGFIAIGSAITSYARNFTIRVAQMNYHGVTERGFIYADTDSIHCDLEPEELKGIEVDDNAFCCWKLEAQWDEAIFTRQKTYIEHVIKENQEYIDKPYYNVKCAGMQETAKGYFINSITGTKPNNWDDLKPEIKEFISVKRTLNDFKLGLEIPYGKLAPIRMSGGVVLMEGNYVMRK